MLAYVSIDGVLISVPSHGSLENPARNNGIRATGTTWPAHR
jgi:hypothetical protein